MQSILNQPDVTSYWAKKNATIILTVSRNGTKY